MRRNKLSMSRDCSTQRHGMLALPIRLGCERPAALARNSSPRTLSFKGVRRARLVPAAAFCLRSPHPSPPLLSQLPSLAPREPGSGNGRAPKARAPPALHNSAGPGPSHRPPRAGSSWQRQPC